MEKVKFIVFYTMVTNVNYSYHIQNQTYFKLVNGGQVANSQHRFSGADKKAMEKIKEIYTRVIKGGSKDATKLDTQEASWLFFFKKLPRLSEYQKSLLVHFHFGEAE